MTRVRIADSYLQSAKEVRGEKKIKMLNPELCFHVSSLEVEASVYPLVLGSSSCITGP